jgi:large conductance mechanosensitive channel
LINAFVASFITPCLGLIGTDNNKQAVFSINGTIFPYGLFVSSFISFVLICTIVYFAIVMPFTAMLKKVYPALYADPKACPGVYLNVKAHEHSNLYEACCSRSFVIPCCRMPI